VLVRFLQFRDIELLHLASEGLRLQPGELSSLRTAFALQSIAFTLLIRSTTAYGRGNWSTLWGS
jgi:hypothetical protein